MTGRRNCTGPAPSAAYLYRGQFRQAKRPGSLGIYHAYGRFSHHRDWEGYIAGTPHQPYDPKKFFWWRNYRAFGTGVAGDLFVHLLSGIHVITGSKGPEKIFSSGQTAYGRMAAMCPM